MDARLIARLDGTQQLDPRDIGGKAARLNELARAGYRVPAGFCLTTAAYSNHIVEHRLESLTQIIEAVPGPCGDLVDGVVDPDRWVLDRESGEVKSWRPGSPAPAVPSHEEGRPRQLVGQPASPGLATGPARHVRRADDIGRFRAGDVLVCDAIQPNMTHLVPLACAIVERRGGMLIHGAIIARELGIPCVNGVSRCVDDIPDSEVLTVDGELGIVTVGAPELLPRPT